MISMSHLTSILVKNKPDFTPPDSKRGKNFIFNVISRDSIEKLSQNLFFCVRIKKKGVF